MTTASVTDLPFYPADIGVLDSAPAFCEALLEKNDRGPFAVEILNPDLSAMPTEDFCRQAFAGASHVLTQARGMAAGTPSGAT